VNSITPRTRSVCSALTVLNMDTLKCSRTREGPIKDPSSLRATVSDPHVELASQSTNSSGKQTHPALPKQHPSSGGFHPEDATSLWTSLPIKRRNARAPIVPKFRNEDAAIHTRSSLIASRARRELALSDAQITTMAYESAPEESTSQQFSLPDSASSDAHSLVLRPSITS
jgi:hypothetical protein